VVIEWSNVKVSLIAYLYMRSSFLCHPSERYKVLSIATQPAATLLQGSNSTYTDIRYCSPCITLSALHQILQCFLVLYGFDIFYRASGMDYHTIHVSAGCHVTPISVIASHITPCIHHFPSHIYALGSVANCFHCLRTRRDLYCSFSAFYTWQYI
jgi:hypothetical protein